MLHAHDDTAKLSAVKIVDGLRTARVLTGMLRDLARDGGPDTTNAAGLAEIRVQLAARLRQLDITVRVSGEDRVPREGGVIFMWNQTSHLDHLVVPLAIPRPFHSTYNNELRRFPIYGKRLARSDHFWLDRNNEAQWRAQLAEAARRVRDDGACVLISPEGTRSRDGKLLPMKRGAFYLARLAARPIVCVCIRGAHELLARGSLIVKPGTIEVEVAPPIEVDEESAPVLEQRVVERFTRTAQYQDRMPSK